jgi:hypothetical protein
MVCSRPRPSNLRVKRAQIRIIDSFDVQIVQRDVYMIFGFSFTLTVLTSSIAMVSICRLNRRMLFSVIIGVTEEQQNLPKKSKVFS